MRQNKFSILSFLRPSLSQEIEKHIKPFHYGLHFCDSEENLFSLMESQETYLVLLDENAGDRKKIVSKIREHRRGALCKIALVSDITDKDETLAVYECGVNYILPLSFEIKHIINIIIDTEIQTRDGHKTRALVADSNATDRESVGMELAEAGFQVLFAENAKEALDIAALERPDVIVMDSRVQMQDMDIHQACMELKNNTNAAKPPIVILLQPGSAGVPSATFSSTVSTAKIAGRTPALPGCFTEYFSKSHTNGHLGAFVKYLLSQREKTALPVTVLVAEDDGLTCNIYSSFLTSRGFKCEIVENGQRALEALERGLEPSIILLDCYMPVMNGFEACLKIKGNERFSHIPVIMVTSSHRKEDILAALRAGAADYITKPFNAKELLARMETHVKNFFLTKKLHEQNKILEERGLALSSINSYFDSILRSSTDMAIAATDIDLRVTYYNPAAEELFGLKASEVIGKTVQETHSKKNISPSLFEQAMETVKKDGEYRNIVQMKTNDDARTMEFRVSGIFYTARVLSGFLLLARDITESKKMEEELRLNEKRFEILWEVSQIKDVSLKQISDFIVEKGVELTKSELGFFGTMSKDESILEVTSWSEHAMSQCAMENRPIAFPIEKAGVWAEAVRRREPIIINNYEAPAPGKKGTPEGHVKLTRLMIVPLFKKDRIVALAAVGNKKGVYDETDLRQLTLIMEGMLRIVEQKEAGEALKKAKEMAEEATRLKDKFVSLVAHDLRSPFNSIIGFLKLLQQDATHPLDEKQNAIVDKVLNSGSQMIRLIEEILNISRIKSGAIKPKYKFIDAYFVSLEAMAQSGYLTRQKGITLRNEVPRSARLYADPDLFREVIINLVSNAIKFCRQGDTISIFIPPDKKSAIAVRDTGVGISEKMLQHLFRPEEKTTARGTAGEVGTGFGLPLSHDIMEAHGGSLTVQSVEGEGSVFTAELPLVRPLVMLVDDDQDVRFLEKGLLRELDVDFLEAENGEEALALLENNNPHLIILDIVMPFMDGLQVLEAVRKNQGTQSIPVIVVTTGTDMETRNKAFALGASDFVVKPFETHDLVSRVSRFLG